MANKPITASALSLLPAILLTFWGPCFNCQSDVQVGVDRNGTRLFPLAKRYLENGKPEAAGNLLETLLQLYPNDAEAHLYLGEAYALKKNYPKARFELVHCLRMRDRLDIAIEANQQLLKLPKRWLLPKKLGCLASENPQAPAAKQYLLLFFADWDAGSIRLKEVAESCKNQAPNLTIKTLALGDPNGAAIFDLYNVSAIPTVVVLSRGKQNISASMVGAIGEQRLRNLLASHRNL